MRPAYLFRTAAWLVRDTFRQSLASGLVWLLLAASAISILVCASAHIDNGQPLAAPGEQPDYLPRHDADAQNPKKLKDSGVNVATARMTLAFGAIEVPLARDAHSAVHFLQLVLAGGVADTLGLLLTLIWTAGFLPGFLEGRSISVLLAKPASRWVLLLGKYVGVLGVVTANAVLFVGGTWLAIGCRTGIWDASYLWAVPLLLLHFSVFFSFSALLAVYTENTVVCVLGSILFWCLAWGMNYGRHALAAAAQLVPEDHFSHRLQWLADAAYWVLPKPADFGLLLHRSLEADQYFQSVFDLKALEAQGFSWLLSVATSLLFAVYVLTTAARKFQKASY